MKLISELDISDLSAPLERGTTLIEASAGTGKTYTLAALFLRLVLEEGLEVREILVTTFTVPATAELRGRIRKLLRDAEEALGGAPTKDPFLLALSARFAGEAELMCERLAAALRSFDEAAIHTIHSFCERTLRDRAFESGATFDQELVADEREIIREVAEDFWRRKFYECDICLGASAAAANLSPAAFAKLLRDRLSHPFATIIPARNAGEIDALQSSLQQTLQRLQEVWQVKAEEIRAIFLKKNSWAKLPYTQVDVARDHLENVHACLEDPANLPGFASLLFFTSEAIGKGVRKRSSQPAHEFFDLCGELAEHCRRYALDLQLEFLEWAPGELDRRKFRQNVVSFDDLLMRLHRSLVGEGGEELATAIRGRFKAALIDEFQDTDALQEEIFRRIFGDGAGWLFLIGDPKQAIYSFRSADIFTYLNAVDHADRHFTLATNFRSSEALIAATNRLFSRPSPDRSFILDRIQFRSVKSCGTQEAGVFSGDGISAPFRIWAFPGDRSERTDDSTAAVVAAVSMEIARLLQGGGMLGDRPVVPGDIAVLTRTNPQALDILHALQSLGVPGVVLSNGNVFGSPEAHELLTVLAAVSRPRAESRIRAALLTDLIGHPATKVHGLSEDEAAWEVELVRFLRWHELWITKGFIQMFRQLLIELNVRARLLAHPDGERRLTNLLQLSELLQQAATEHKYSAAALQKWLAEQISQGSSRGEEHEMRLERDDDAVRIVTIHKSKGLEYNIVFCPFLWTRFYGGAKGPVHFHDPDQEGRLTFDLGSESLERNRGLAAEEDLAEHARLAYVAMTRARQRCDLVWGQFKSVPDSSVAWLLHQPDGQPGRVVPTLRDHMKDLPATQWRADLDALASGSNGAIQIVEPPDPPAVAPRYIQRDVPVSGAPLSFDGSIERDWSVSSFSSLAEQYDAEAPDHDPRPEEAPVLDEKEPEGIHAFPAGARTGNCLHEILQDLDFSTRNGLDALVTRKLQAFSFDPLLWKATVKDCLERTLSTKLAPGFSLGEIPPAARLTELEFYLPAGRLDAASLRAVLTSDAERLEFSPRRGWLKGFIDMVFQHEGRFYLADWKSNRLGSHVGAYTQAALGTAMTAHRYGLQYHLYTVALHRYLKWRIPRYDYERHFGGVFYIFLRGVEPARPELGIIHRRPKLATIEGLDQWMK